MAAPPEIQVFSYRRHNAFNQVLLRVQGKQNVTITQEYIEMIMNDIEKNDHDIEITPRTIKNSLDRLG